MREALGNACLVCYVDPNGVPPGIVTLSRQGGEFAVVTSGGYDGAALFVDDVGCGGPDTAGRAGYDNDLAVQ